MLVPISYEGGKTMPNPNNRTVYQTPDGDWANKKNGNSRPSKLYDTQKDAIADAHRQIHNAGGGELTIMGTNHQIRRKLTVSPGIDPYPPKDKT